MNYTTILDAAKFMEVPVDRVLGLIRTGQLNGVTIPGSEELGFVNVDDILDLVKV